MGDFWEEMRHAYTVTPSIDRVLQDRGQDPSTCLQDLTDRSKVKNALALPVTAGTRVRFIANIGSVMSYTDLPGKNVLGTVVTVRTASGDVTSQDDRVFVLWDDGKYRVMQAEHLRTAKRQTKLAKQVRREASSFDMILKSFSPVASGNDNLVHKATKDLWSYRKDGGRFVLERLFSEDGSPLKI